MTPARQRPPSRRSDDSSNYLFYGLLALTSALFLAAAIAILRDDEVRDSSPPTRPIPVLGRPTATATHAAVAPPTAMAVPPTATLAVVLVERRPPTQTPRLTPATVTTPTAVVPPPTTSPAPSITPTPEALSATPTPVVVTATDTATPPPTPTSAERIHVVRAGDSLQLLGDQYGVRWQSIRDANGLPDGAILQIDQRLVIPGA